MVTVASLIYQKIRTKVTALDGLSYEEKVVHWANW
jgi:hypothetical protein